MGNDLNLKPSKPEGVYCIITAKPHPSVIQNIIYTNNFNLHVVLANLIMTSSYCCIYMEEAISILLLRYHHDLVGVLCIPTCAFISFENVFIVLYIIYYVGLLYRSG